VIEARLKTGGTEADAWRKRQLALMGGISQFIIMKGLKAAGSPLRGLRDDTPIFP
jgi:hypothetical protein